MIKKLISILLVVMMLTTLAPSVIYAASTTEQIPAAFGSYVRGHSSTVNSVLKGNDLMYVRATTSWDVSNVYYSFLTFDFAGYESKLDAASSVKLKLKAGRYNDSKVYGFTVSVLPDSADALILDGTSLTYNSLSTNNMHKLGTVVMTNSDTHNNGAIVETDDIKDAILTALSENTENSTVSFRISAVDTNLSTFYGYANHKIELAFDTDSVSDLSYVQSKADMLKWSDLSSESEASVTQNLTLPSKYYGADVTWSSSDPVVGSDGTVTLAKGNAKDVTLTATFKYNNAQTEKTFEFTVPGILPTLETKVYDERTHVKGNAANSVVSINYNTLYMRNTGLNQANDWYAFYKFDLSGMEDKIANASKATLTLKSSNKATAFTVALLADKCDIWSPSTLTYNIANELGMLSNSANSTDIETGITLVANTEYTTGNFADALRAAIADNPTNSTVTFRLYGDTSTLIEFKGTSNVKLNLEYYNDDLNADALFEAKKDTLAWDDITSQSINSVTSDLKLPNKFYGFNMTWNSDNAAIDASTGKVTQSKSGDVKVNLTATILNGSASYSKVFEVTVPAPQKSSFTLEYSDWAITRGLNRDIVKNEAYGWVYARNAGLNDDNDRYIYYSFDLTGHEEKIMNASEVNLSFKAQAVSGGTWQLSILPATTNRWTHDTLTYGVSNALGMMDDATVIQSGIKVNAGETYVSTDFADAIKSVLANNPANSVITLRISAETNTDTGFQRISPNLNISYYDMDLDTEAFYADVKDDLAWDDITTQPIESVITDLKLPKKFYGFDVTWASDDVQITSSGEVTIADTAKQVKLTATISNGTESYDKVFDVTVANKAYGLDFSNASGSGAKIYANVAESKAGVLILAAYSGNALISVTAVDVTITDGENLINSLFDSTGATEIKAMLLTDMNSLTPLCSFKSTNK